MELASSRVGYPESLGTQVGEHDGRSFHAARDVARQSSGHGAVAEPVVEAERELGQLSGGQFADRDSGFFDDAADVPNLRAASARHGSVRSIWSPRRGVERRSLMGPRCGPLSTCSLADVGGLANRSGLPRHRRPFSDSDASDTFMCHVRARPYTAACASWIRGPATRTYGHCYAGGDAAS